MLYDVAHNLGEGLERDTISGWRRLRLQANLGDNEWLCADGSKCLRERAKDCESQQVSGLHVQIYVRKASCGFRAFLPGYRSSRRRW
jgi:hypothetical protein